MAVSASSTSASSGSGAGGDDPGWVQVPWAPRGCVIEYAGNPAAAFPPTEWKPCPGGEPGCEMMVPNWAGESQGSAWVPKIIEVGGSYVMGFQAVSPEEYRGVVMRDGTPTAVYRMARGQSCYPAQVVPTASGHWFGIHDDYLPSVYVHQPHGQPPTSAEVAPFVGGCAYQWGTDGAFAVSRYANLATRVFDRVTGLVDTSPDGEYSSDMGFVPGTDDAGLLTISDTQPEGWVWTRDGGFTPLLQPAGASVTDVRSDGDVLVWVEAAYSPEGDWPPGTLYTSPLALEPEGIVPARVRDVESGSPVRGAVGGGYYAFYPPEGPIHLLRLSDGQLWVIPIPHDGLGNKPAHLTFVDETYLFHTTTTQFVRQRIDALGEGTPAPPR